MGEMVATRYTAVTVPGTGQGNSWARPACSLLEPRVCWFTVSLRPKPLLWTAIALGLASGALFTHLPAYSCIAYVLVPHAFFFLALHFSGDAAARARRRKTAQN